MPRAISGDQLVASLKVVTNRGGTLYEALKRDLNGKNAAALTRELHW